jgi:hypothetical protein
MMFINAYLRHEEWREDRAVNTSTNRETHIAKSFTRHGNSVVANEEHATAPVRHRFERRHLTVTANEAENVRRQALGVERFHRVLGSSNQPKAQNNIF